MIFVLLVAWLAMAPFVMIKRPWALRFRQKIRTGFLIYVIVMVAATVIALVLRWDQIYG